MNKETIRKMSNKLLDLIQQSVIVQGVLTLGVVALWCTMLFIGKAVPDSLNQIVGLVVGFYFGGKAVLGAQSIRKV